MSNSITHSKSYSSDVIGGIDPVTIDSSICSENNYNDYEEEFSEELTTKLMQKHLGYGVTSRRWRRRNSLHSVIYAEKEVYYSKDYSTSMLIWHMKRHHKDIYKHHLESKAEEKLAKEGKGDAQLLCVCLKRLVA